MLPLTGGNLLHVILHIYFGRHVLFYFSADFINCLMCNYALYSQKLPDD